MIQPFTRHFFELSVPVLVQVMKSPRKVTLRTFREAEGVTAKESGSRVLKGAGVAARLAAQSKGRERDWRGRLIAGHLLHERFDGRAFEFLGSAVLDLDGPLGRSEWTDYGNWVFPLDREGTPGTPFNRYIDSKDSRVRTPRLLALKGINCALQIYAPFAAGDFGVCSFSLTLNPDYGFIGNLDPGAETTYEEVLKGAGQAFPKLGFTGPDSVPANGSVSLSLAVTDWAGNPVNDAAPEVFLESTGGYLPLQRAVPVAGAAEVRVMALGLKAGESIRIKAGFRHVSGLAEHTLAVV